MNRLAAARNLLKVWLFLAAICALLGLLGWIAGELMVDLVLNEDGASVHDSRLTTHD